MGQFEPFNHNLLKIYLCYINTVDTQMANDTPEISEKLNPKQEVKQVTPDDLQKEVSTKPQIQSKLSKKKVITIILVLLGLIVISIVSFFVITNCIDY